MIHNLKPYSKYKNSGVPWLGEVPEHWELQRGKWLFRHKKEINSRNSNSNILSLTLRGVVNNDPDNPEGLVPKDYATYQLFKKGDLVFKLIDLENLRTSRVGLVHEDGIMSPAYVRLIPQSVNCTHFFFHQYFDLYQRGIYNQLGAGVRSTLSPNDLLNLSILVPPLTEQSAIVRYLDQMNRRIRRYIHAKQKLIKLLEEQKQVIIHQAVTHGLDPNVKLKPSEVEWLGDVPEHWTVIRISYFAKVGNGSTPSRSNIAYWNNGTYPWLNSSHVNRGFIDSSNQFVTDIALKECHLPHVPAGSVLIAITGQGKTRGTAAVLNIEATINQHIAFITPKSKRVLSEFLQLALVGAYQALRAISDDSGSTKGALTCEDIKRFKLAIPPKKEQESLIAYIKVVTGHLTNAIDNAHQEISLLREYRTRLIADVVTGKLDVRDAAANLSEETEIETCDDTLAEESELGNNEIEDEQTGELEEVLV